MNVITLSTEELRALRWAVKNTDWTALDRESSQRASLERAAGRLQEASRGDVVVVLSKPEARALERAVGNSMNDGADRDVFPKAAEWNAAWRGREKLQGAIKESL